MAVNTKDSMQHSCSHPSALPLSQHFISRASAITENVFFFVYQDEIKRIFYTFDTDMKIN